jgi:hypothetical protein
MSTETTELTEVKPTKTVDPVKSAKMKEAADKRAEQAKRMQEKHLATLVRAQSKKGDLQNEFINSISGVKEAKRTEADWNALVADGTLTQKFLDKILNRGEGNLENGFDFLLEKAAYKSKASGLPRQPKGPDPVFGYACVRRLAGVEVDNAGVKSIVPTSELIQGEVENADKSVSVVEYTGSQVAAAGVAVRTAMDALLKSPEYLILESCGLDLEPYWRNLNNEGQGGPRSADKGTDVTSPTEEVVA